MQVRQSDTEKQQQVRDLIVKYRQQWQDSLSKAQQDWPQGTQQQLSTEIDTQVNSASTMLLQELVKTIYGVRNSLYQEDRAEYGFLTDLGQYIIKLRKSFECPEIWSLHMEGLASLGVLQTLDQDLRSGDATLEALFQPDTFLHLKDRMLEWFHWLRANLGG